jgi:small subunit ribosomal protein S1
MISRTFFVFLALVVSTGVLANVWLGSFIPTISRRSATRLNMVSVLDGKQVRLEKSREKFSGRSDLISMLDEEEDEVESYNLFAEADEAEVDPPKTGQTITGTVIEMDDNGALLEIGGKMSGYLPLKEASLIPIKHVNTILEIGQELTAEVIGTLKGMPVISLRAAQLVTAWEQALSMRATDAVFEVKVLEVNRGGVIVSALGLKAFLPGSHYMGTPDESIIGSTLKVRTIA